MKTIILTDGTILNATDGATVTSMSFNCTAAKIATILPKLTTENMRHVVIKDGDEVIQEEHRVISTNSASISGDFEADELTLIVNNRYMTEQEITNERLDDVEDAILDE